METIINKGMVKFHRYIMLYTESLLCGSKNLKGQYVWVEGVYGHYLLMHSL